MATNYGYFTNASSGAPTLNGVAGSLISVLDWLLDVSNTNGRQVATKVYSGTNKAVYLFNGNASYFRVDDAYGAEARVRLYESMSDVDTGVDACPTIAGLSDANGNWRKSFEANSNARSWRAVVCELGVHLFVEGIYFGTNDNDIYSMMKAIRTDGVSDAWNVFFTPRPATGQTRNGQMQGAQFVVPNFNVTHTAVAHFRLPRTEDGLTKATAFRPTLPNGGSAWSTGLNYPSTAFVGIQRVWLLDLRGTGTNTPNCRGYVPYLYGMATQIGHADLNLGTSHTDGTKSFVSLKAFAASTSANEGRFLETSDTDPLVP